MRHATTGDMRWAAALGVLALLCSCGGRYGMKVPDSMFDKLPYETRVELLEAENDLALALDHVDEAENEVQRTRDNIRRAKDRRSAAKSEVGQADDDNSRQIAELAVEEAEARVDHLKVVQKLNVKKIDVRELELRCAHARYQQARLTIARKAKIEGSESLDPADFEAQVKSCEAEVVGKKEGLKEHQAQVAAAKEAWDAKKAELAKRTFDARASPYVE